MLLRAEHWECATYSLSSRLPHTAYDQSYRGKRNEVMSGPIPTRPLMLSVAVVALIAAHGAVLSCVSSHTGATAAVLSGAIVLMVVKHLGLLGPLYALLRRHLRRNSR